MSKKNRAKQKHSQVATASAKDLRRIWGAGGFRLFLSHVHAAKKETENLQLALREYGISSFVAHKNIRPTRQWQMEIEKALDSMHGFAALMTKGFHDSNWTDQEIGFAVARRIPIVPVALGTLPYGFIGKIQALECSWDSAAKEIAAVLIENSKALDAYIQALGTCASYSQANRIGALLPAITQITAGQVRKLVSVYNANPALRISFVFNGKKARAYGHGLLHYLNRLGKGNFWQNGNGKILRIT